MVVTTVVSMGPSLVGLKVCSRVESLVDSTVVRMAALKEATLVALMVFQGVDLMVDPMAATSAVSMEAMLDERKVL